jgi:hypothetical protein
MFFIEYHIKNQKAFWAQWEKAQNNLPKDSHFIQCFSSKNAELCVSVWDCKSRKVLESFTKEYFTGCSSWSCHEIDMYHTEGEPLKRLIA